MAERKTVYPMLPVNHWWALREKFKQSIPGTVTANYLATVLNMKEVSARANILPFIQKLGITDDEGKTLDRAREWRDDTMYPDVVRRWLKKCTHPNCWRPYRTQPIIALPRNAGLVTKLELVLQP